jgi:hypothetical protein
MLRRSFATLALAAMTVAGLPMLGSPAQAVGAPVDFSAAKLPTWQTNNVVFATASAQGLVFAGGNFSRIRPPGQSDYVTTTDGSGNTTTSVNPAAKDRANLAVFDAATGDPTSCVLDVTGSSVTVRALAVSPDGTTLYVGGFFTAIGGVARNNVAAVNIATCTVSDTWAPSASSYVRVIKPFGSTVYLGGSFGSVSGQAHQRVAAVSASTGQVLSGFEAAFDGTQHDTLVPDVIALDLKPDGSVLVVGGNFDTADGADSHALAVVDAQTGALVKAFPGFISTYVNASNRGSSVKTIVTDSTGFYTGNEGSGKYIFDGRIAVNWGTYDERWRDGCLGATQALLVYDDLLYVASHAHDCSNVKEYGDGQRRHFLAETTGSGTPDDHSKPALQGWTPDTNDGTGEGIGPRTLTIGRSGGVDYLWSGGEFTTVNGIAQQGLTRFGHSTTVGATVNPTLSVTSSQSGVVNVAARTTTDNDDGTLTYRFYRDGASSPSYVTTASSRPWSRPQVTWVDNQTPGSTHTYRVTASDGTLTASSATTSVQVAAVGSAYAQRVEADQPLFHLRDDEASGLFLADASGNGNSLKLNATPGMTYQQTGAVLGDPSKALTFGGDATSFAVTEKRFDAPTTYTLETWFKTASGSGGKLIGFSDSQTLPSQDYSSLNAEHHIADKLLYLTNSGQLVFGTEGTPGTKQVVTSPSAYKNDVWHYAVATQDSSGMALYVDGTRVARNTVTTRGGGNGFWRIGGDSINGWPSSPTSGYLDGSLDETAVYPRALTATEVAEHFALGGGTFSDGPTDYYGKIVYDEQPVLQWRLNESAGPAAADSTGANNRGTYVGNVTYAQTGAVANTSGTTARSVKLDGTNALVTSATSSPALAQYTTEAWVKTTSATGGQIVGFGTSATGDSSTQDRKTWFRNDGKISFGVRQGSGYYVVTSPTAYNDGAFHHVVSTKSATTMALWVDGAMVASNAVTANQSYTGYWRFGEDAFTGWSGAPSSKYLNGTLDELAVYTGVLAASRIQAHYNGGVPTSGQDVAAPTAPAAVTVGLTGADVGLTWRASLDNVGVTGYEVHRSTTSGFAPSPSTKVGTTTGTTYTDAGVPQGTFYYRIVALDAAANATSSSQVSIVATDVAPPTTPTGVIATGGSSSASLAWTASTDNTGVVGYQVYRGTAPGVVPSPGSLLVTTTDPSYIDIPPTNGTWYYVITAQDAAGNVSGVSAEVNATIADITAPTAPSLLTGKSSGPTATLTWNAASDDTAVTGYQVFRASAPGAAGTLVKTVTTTTTTDAPGLGTWYYRIVAKDGANNLSPTSNEARVFVSSTSALLPTADTFANQGAPSTNYGTNASLVSNGTGSSAAVSYLRFQVPTVPAGSQITSVALRIRTSTRAKCSCDASSLATHAIRFASDSWDESTLTWNLKPALTGTPIGNLVSPSTEDATFDATLDNAAIQAVGGTQVTLGMQATTNDNLWFASSNTTTTANRPQLLITMAPIGFDPAAPTQPTGVTSSRTDGTLHLTWNASTDDVGTPHYDIYRSGSPGTAPSPATRVGSSATPAYDDAPGLGTWYYQVVALDDQGHASPPSDELTASVPDYTAPTAPTGVTLTSSGPTVSLSWTAATDNAGVQSYDVHRSSTSGFTPSASTYLSTVTGTSETDTVAAGTWYYQVVAKDAVGNATASAEAAITVTDGTAPTSPSGLTAVQQSDQVVLTWNAATDAFGVSYAVYRSTLSGAAMGPSTWVHSGPETTWSDPAPTTGTTYYRVVAHDPSGNVSPPSNEASVLVVDITPPSTVTDLAGSQRNNGVDLTWTASTDNTAVTSYVVYRGSTQVGTPLGSSFTDASGPGTWRYTVVAKDGAGNTSATSNEAVVTVDDKTAPSNPSSLTASASGTAIDLSWTGSTDDVAVQNYEIHRSTVDAFTPSTTTLITTTNGPVTTYSDHPGGGTWYYRIVAVDTSGNPSAAPSNTASATLADSTPPTAPTNVVATQPTQSVSLTWTASTDAYGVTEYDVYRSATSGGASSLVGISATPSFTDSAPLGTSYYTVIAKDAAGNASPASTEISVTVTDKTGPSQSTVTATVSGATVALSWTASTDNVGVTGYELHRSADPAFVPNASTLVTRTTGATSYSDTPGAGTWYYRVVAFDAAANKGTPSDAATAAGVTAGATTIVSVVATADAFGNQGAATTNYGTNTSLLSKGGTTAAAASYLRFVIPAAPAGTTLSGAVLKVRTTTDSTAASNDPHTISIASDSWTESTLTWNNRPAVTSTVLGTLTGASAVNTAYSATLDPAQVKLLIGTQTSLAVMDGQSTDSLYFWSKNFSTVASQPTLVLTYVSSGGSGDTSPPTAPSSLAASVSGPTVSLTWGAATDNVGVTGYEVYRSATSGFTPSAGNRVATVTSLAYTENPGTGTWYYLVLAKDAAGLSSPASNQATAVVAPDTVAPSAPASLSATVSGSSVALSWTASSDAFGVTAYELHRSATSGFTPSGTTLVTTVTGTSVSDAPGNGSWYYLVVAKDAAGNASTPSNQAAATVSSSGGTPTSVTLSPTADTFGNAGAATTNYGTNSSLLSRGSTGAATYLRFVLPTAPSGQSLTGAVLRFRTTTDSTAGSADSHAVQLVTDDTWTEAGLTWNNRPAINGSLLGSITGATAVNTSYDTTLSPSVLAPLLGTQQSVGISSTGTDSLYLWSRNFSTVTSRPQLILTFS